MSAFWIHCNICNTLLSAGTKHYLLTCNHVLCNSCMKHINNKKCPLDKQEVQFKELAKLPGNVKNNFQPNLKSLLSDSAKILSFQQNHIRNMLKLTRDYKMKSCQAIKILEKEKQQILKAKAQLERMVNQRRMMQAKLKELFMQNKLKEKSEIYRNPANSTISSNFSSLNTQSSLQSSPKVSRSEFFNQNLLQDSSSTGNTSDFFRPRRLSTNNKRPKNIEHTQSERTPFFA